MALAQNLSLKYLPLNTFNTLHKNPIPPAVFL